MSPSRGLPLMCSRQMSRKKASRLMPRWQHGCTRREGAPRVLPRSDMFANFDIALTWHDLIKRTAHETMRDDAQGLASQLAYYFFLALFPALLCLLAIASFFPLQNFTDDVVRVIGPFAPQVLVTIIQDQMIKIAEGHSSGLLTIGLLGAIWSSSAAMVAVTS